ncbi:hypothetical protein [Acinetobacter sp. ANC 3832]|uniref:hypothetical protein n=1 Tax=Acinetobacter sp. ANC 3832 TaxID=1977874 RepID=UPI000A338351|nr:hypothetical protein [Acinetobacter sp. ANC 3832]OTG95013.1 hypothetical protein B9T35_06535 [Acinetobacter sp. ANC 3832]
MNTAVVKQHILQSVDWSRFDLEGWLQQFGAWLYTNTGSSGRTVNPIAVAMDNAVKAKKSKKLNADQQLQVITDFLTGDYESPKPRKTKMTCEIDDNEARAVQRLVLDIKGQSEVLDDWMDAIISRYFYTNSWSEMVRQDRTQNDARSDVKCGLAVLHSRYGFIGY